MLNLHGNIYDIGKLVYAYHNLEGRSLDPQDNRWDVEHIDGNLNNNYIGNLKYIEK